MKIAVVTSIVPFVFGGGRNIVEWLAEALREAGHEVDIIALPFDESPGRIVAQMAAFRMIDLTDEADLVVCVRPPSYLVQHPRKVLWFLHQIRPYYDLWDTEYRGFGDTAVARARRDMIRRVDDRAFAEAARVFTISQVVTDRLAMYNGVESEVLFPPISNPSSFSSSGYGDEIVAVSRLEHHKRQHLLVEALGLTKTQVRLRLIGKGSTPHYGNQLREQAISLGLGNRVVIEDAWVEEGRKRELINASLAGAYIPLDEDAYGYPTLESAHASKAIITASDSGGVLEFVTDGGSGLVVEPTAEALAEAMDKLWLDRDLAEKLGTGASVRLTELPISWSHVVDRITSI
ncbi:MAG: hypothetical protein QOH44_573 [Actinomycetota bacterium]|nr:hypothetical protein [Actinomycetota bacterium]